MKKVQFGKVWDIRTAEDLQKAWDQLDENEFVANMSDDWLKATEELNEIHRQRKAVALQARANGII